MDTAMTNIKEMVDVNTIVGDAVETIDGTVIIPISRVSFGFAAGGGDMTGNSKSQNQQQNKNKSETPQNFSGGSGGGVMLNPVAFLVVKDDKVRLMPVTKNATIERLINTAPEVLDQIKNIMESKTNNKK